MKNLIFMLSLAAFASLLPGCCVEQKRTPVSPGFMNGPPARFTPQERAQ